MPISNDNRQENLLFQNLFHALFLTCLSVFSFFKISLLMAKCQKSENFLSELQQAFLQAKRSVQEQMVRQVNSRECLVTLGAQCVWKRLCLPTQGWLQRAEPLHLQRAFSSELWWQMLDWNSCVIVCCVHAHPGACRSLASFSSPYSWSNSMPLWYLNFTSHLKTVDFLKTLF